jgi:predicted LPLAT superfamily acyltransferase
MLRRATRAEDLRAVIGRYAAALERACRAHPFQWFNFYPFWETPVEEKADPGTEPSRAAVVPAVLASRG